MAAADAASDHLTATDAQHFIDGLPEMLGLAPNVSAAQSTPVSTAASQSPAPAVSNADHHGGDHSDGWHWGEFADHLMNLFRHGHFGHHDSDTDMAQVATAAVNAPTPMPHGPDPSPMPTADPVTPTPAPVDPVPVVTAPSPVDPAPPVTHEPAPTPAPAAVDPPAPAPAHGFELGINLAGAEFGSLPGKVDTDYIYPTKDSIDQYAAKGFDTVRLPFLWERVQPTMKGPLSQTELAQIDAVGTEANAQGMKVILDVHNYGFGYGNAVGSAGTPDAAFADLWGKLGQHFADNPEVVFGLMNEPYQQTAEQWLGSTNAAIAAIRGAGATSQEVLVSGSHWDGAWTWTTSDNASVIGSGVKDPSNHFAFEVHQYLDSDGSGTHAQVVSETVGVERLQAVTQWAEQTGNKLYLGEFGVANDPTSLAAMDKMLAYAQAHPQAWEGGAYWAGGPWWGNYMYSVEPDHGVQKPQMAVLEHYA